MKIQILSDLHLEFGELALPEEDRDLLILAGDVHVGSQAREFLEQQTKISPVIYIMGNHEFYHEDLNETYRYWQQQKMANLKVLENTEYIWSGVRFLGCCLWTDFNQGSELAMKQVESGLNDYQVIINGERRLFPNDTLEIHRKSITWLEKTLSIPFQGKTIVITHHLPSARSVAPRFHNDPLNFGFYSGLDTLILKYHPAVWVHGHTHDSFDYMLGSTRILCNPRGYRNWEENKSFDPGLIIEI